MFANGSPTVQPSSVPRRRSKRYPGQRRRNRAECPCCPMEHSHPQSSQKCFPVTRLHHSGTLHTETSSSAIIPSKGTHLPPQRGCENLPSRAAKLNDNENVLSTFISCCFYRKRADKYQPNLPAHRSS